VTPSSSSPGWLGAFGWTLLGLAVVVAYQLGSGLSEVVYALDDPYIHLGVAKHLVNDGVWGISTAGSASVSSSPLWTALLAGTMALFGVWDGWALVWAAFCAVGLAGELGRWGMRGAARGAVLFATGWVALLFAPMEHLAHAWAVLGWVRTSVVGSDRASGLYGALACTLRPESIFILPVLALVSGRRAVWRVPAWSLGFLGAGVVHLLSGGSWIPATLTAKSALIHRPEGLAGLLAVLTSVPGHVAAHPPAFLWTLIFLVVAVGTVALRADVLSRWGWGTLVAGVVGQVAFGQLGWLFRYEAWLVALGLGVGVRAVQQVGWPASPVLRTVWALTVGLLVLRGGWSLSAAWGGANDLRRQQLPMAFFVRDTLQNAPVALNDVGAVGFYSEAPLFDLVGLGDRAVIQARAEGRFTTAWIASEAERRKIVAALVYPSWFVGERALPASFERVGQLVTPGVTVAGGDTVSIYAVAMSPSVLREGVEAAGEGFHAVQPEP